MLGSGVTTEFRTIASHSSSMQALIFSSLIDEHKEVKSSCW